MYGKVASKNVELCVILAFASAELCALTTSFLIQILYIDSKIQQLDSYYSQHLHTAHSLIYLQALSHPPKLLQLLVPTSGFS